MTPPELLAMLITAFPHQRLEKDSQRLWLAHLAALPADRTERAVRRLVLVEEFFPSVAKLVALCGVHDETHRLPEGGAANAVDQLAEAISKRLPLVPDLVSVTGWSVGVAVRPIPPPVEEPPALPRGRPISDEQRLQLREMTRSFANGHRVGGDR